MDNFVTCVGWFVVAMFSLGFACAMIALVVYCYGKAMERFEWAVAAKTRLAIGRQIGSGSHWFSESPDTSLALRMLSERIVNGEGVDASQWREEWRRGRKV